MKALSWQTIEMLASTKTVTNSKWAIRVDSCLSPVHLKMKADPDPETLWVFKA
jgi:hypothetical protein